MCLGDWRLGRFIKVDFRNVDTSLGPITIAGQNPQRVGIAIFPQDETAVISISIVKGGVSFVLGSIGFPSANFSATLAEDGQLCQQFFTGTMLAGNGVVTVAEYTLPEEMLTAALESLRRDYGPGLHI